MNPVAVAVLAFYFSSMAILAVVFVASLVIERRMKR